MSRRGRRAGLHHQLEHRLRPAHGQRRSLPDDLMAERTPAIAALAICFTVSLLCGCTLQQDASVSRDPLSSEQVKALGAEERAVGHLEQAEALEDGIVTSQEYDLAFDRLASCLNLRGFTVTSPVVSPVDGVAYEFSSDFGTRDLDSALADLDDCETTHWRSVSMAYELSREPVMDPTLVEASTRCLKEQGYTPNGDERNVADLVRSIGEEEDSIVIDCVHGEAIRLYPELPSLVVGY